MKLKMRNNISLKGMIDDNNNTLKLLDLEYKMSSCANVNFGRHI
jgi:hypothetical protein